MATLLKATGGDTRVDEGEAIVRGRRIIMELHGICLNTYVLKVDPLDPNGSKTMDPKYTLWLEKYAL